MEDARASCSASSGFSGLWRSSGQGGREHGPMLLAQDEGGFHSNQNDPTAALLLAGKPMISRDLDMSDKLTND